MNPSPHVSSLRQTHRVATSLLPVLTASLTVAGAVIAAMEARAPQTESSEAQTSAQAQPSAPLAGVAAGGRRAGARDGVSARRYLATLVKRVLLVTLGIALVLALVYAASVAGQVGRAILLTALILLALYLTEKVARRA